MALRTLTNHRRGLDAALSLGFGSDRVGRRLADEIKQRSSNRGKQPPPAIANEHKRLDLSPIGAMWTPPTVAQTAFASRRSPVRSRLAPSEEVPGNQVVLGGWGYLVGTRVGLRVPQAGTTSGLICGGFGIRRLAGRRLVVRSQLDGRNLAVQNGAAKTATCGNRCCESVAQPAISSAWRLCLVTDDYR